MQGNVGDAPTADELVLALRNHDLFLYFGHGSGNALWILILIVFSFYSLLHTMLVLESFELPRLQLLKLSKNPQQNFQKK
jgi:hypothetical protein